MDYVSAPLFRFITYEKDIPDMTGRIKPLPFCPAGTRSFLRNITAVLFLLFCGQAVQAQITITANQTALQLAQKLTGPGITILNPILNCPALANGVFATVSSNLGLDSGIILTTGRAATTGSSYGANGPQVAGVNNNASTSNNASGDADLNALAGQATHDACRLEFDLIPKGDSIRFDYVFASEEYWKSTCASYNDAFAFFISGPGIIGTQNLALVPGTNIPVTVNSINSGVPGSNSNGTLQLCTAMGTGSPFTPYFVNNAGGTTVTYYGFTKVLTARKEVIPCSTYHLKLTIADASNFLYDSGVFLKAGSLQTGSFGVQPLGTVMTGSPDTLIVKGCNPGKLRFTRSIIKPTPQTVKFILGGTAVNGVDYSLLADSVIIPANTSSVDLTVNGLPTPPNGSKTLKVYLKSPFSCSGVEIVDSTTLILVDTLHIKINTADTVVCRGQSVALRVEGDDQYFYSWSPAAGLDNANIKQPTATVTTSAQTYVLTASWPEAGCAPKSDAVEIRTNPAPIAEAGNDGLVCVGDSIVLSGTVIPDDPSYSYDWSGPAGFNATQLGAIIPAANTTNSGFYVLTVLAEGCAPSKDSVQMQVAPAPSAPMVSNPTLICQHAAADPLSVPGVALQWYTAPFGGTGSSVTPVPNTEQEGQTIYFVSQVVNGCESPRAEVNVIVERCCDGAIPIPNAFTPNNDGHNDLFRVVPADNYRVTQFYVYNRWGQLVYDGTMGAGKSWDGTFNGMPCDPGTYFYQLAVECRNGVVTQYKGEIALLR